MAPDSIAGKSRVKSLIRWAEMVLLAILLVVLAFLAGVRLYDEAASYNQDRRQRIADQFSPRIVSRLASDSRFAKLSVCGDTRSNGCILIQGTINDGNELVDLIRSVYETRPPVSVYYMLTLCTRSSKDSTVLPFRLEMSLDMDNIIIQYFTQATE
jgi:hypothetical protein